MGTKPKGNNFIPELHVNNQEVSLNVNKLAKKLFKLTSIRKGINKSIDDTKNDILLSTTPFTKLKVGKYLLSYTRTSVSSVIDTDLLKTKYPEIYKECLKTKSKSDSLSISKL